MVSNDTFTAEVPKRILETTEYAEWIQNVAGDQRMRIEAAREKIENEGIITSIKSLGSGLYEKKWRSGLRLYFAVELGCSGSATLLLFGSGKGVDQDKAIRRARRILDGRVINEGNIAKKD